MQVSKNERLPAENELSLALAYKKMQTIRRVEEEIERLYPTDKIKSPIHLSIGQEAVAVGVCMALSNRDVVFSNYRGHAHYIAKGGDLNLMWGELYGKSNGGSGGVAGSMHLDASEVGFMCTSAIVASSIPNAAGFALANLMNGSDQVTVCFHGDAATEEGVFWETVNLAALKSLPIIFICENNKYAIYSHTRARTPKDNIVKRAQAFGIEGIFVEKTDVQLVYRAAVAAVEHVRGGKGPILVECMTTRWRDHVGPGEDRWLGYRSDEDLDQAIDNDELVRVRDLLDQSLVERINQEIESELKTAIDFAERGEFPNPEELYTHVYA